KPHPDPMNRNFFAELKRRNVYKVAVAYAVVAWLLIQAASILFPTFEAPPWVMKVFVAVLILGFPIVLIFSWAFEITPEGIKRESEVEPNKSISRPTGRKIVALTIGLAVVAAGLLAFQLLRGTSNQKSANQPGDAKGISEKSIAVLPLVNTSGDPGNDYFSDGLSEELIAVLAKIPDLKIIGRNSSFLFKGKSNDSRTIGEKLGVANLLEGSVRKQGDRVRIVAELINAADGRAVWSETYDRELKDVFAVQSEIAVAVTEQLKTTWLGGGAEAKEAFAKARTAAQTALSLAPHLSAAHEALGYVLLTSDLDFAGAEAELRAAEKLAPADPGPKGALCILLGAKGRLAESENVARQALALDPLGVIRYLNLARVLIGGGRYDEAEAALRKAVALQPAAARLHVHLTTIDVLRGDATGALHDAQLEPPGSWRDYALALAQQAQSDRVAADAALQKLINENAVTSPFQIAADYGLR